MWGPLRRSATAQGSRGARHVSGAAVYVYRLRAVRGRPILEWPLGSRSARRGGPSVDRVSLGPVGRGGIGYVFAIVGLVPIGAVVFDFCLLSLLFKVPFRGTDIRDAGRSDD